MLLTLKSVEINGVKPYRLLKSKEQRAESREQRAELGRCSVISTHCLELGGFWQPTLGKAILQPKAIGLKQQLAYFFELAGAALPAPLELPEPRMALKKSDDDGSSTKTSLFLLKLAL